MSWWTNLGTWYREHTRKPIVETCERCGAVTRFGPYGRPQRVSRLMRAGYDIALCASCIAVVARQSDVDSMLDAIGAYRI